MKNIFLALILALTSVHVFAQKRASETGYGTQNFVINGDMTFWQRGTSFPAAVQLQYTVDRFLYYRGPTAVHTISQTADVPTLAQSKHASQYAMALTLTTPQPSIAAGDFVGLSHRVEGTNWAQIAGKTFTLSFWVKATLPGTYGVSVGNGPGTVSYVSTYTILASETWQKVVVTIPAPAIGTFSIDANTGLSVYWIIASGTTYQTASVNQWISGTYVTSASQVNGVNTGATYFRIAQVMLNTGDRAAPFALAGGTVGNELVLAQRYIEYGSTVLNGYPIAAQQKMHRVNFKVQKRANSGLSYALWDAPQTSGGWGAASRISTINSSGTTTNNVPSPLILADWFGLSVYSSSAGTETGTSFYWAVDSEL